MERLPEMAIKLDEYDGVCVLSMDGDLTGEDVVSARKFAAQYIEKRQICDFVVDLDKTSFIDSNGLETLLWIKRRCEDLFGQFKLASADEHVKKILEVTRLGRRFEIAVDVPSALKTMR
jgi:anti-anti-sigma factor